MSKTTNIKIGRKSYLVAFDYRSLRRITESFGFDSYGNFQLDLVKQGFDNVESDFTFKQYEYLAKMVCEAIKSNPDNKASKLDAKVVEEFLFEHADEMIDIVSLYSAAVNKRLGKHQQVNPKQRN